MFLRIVGHPSKKNKWGSYWLCSTRFTGERSTLGPSLHAFCGMDPPTLFLPPENTACQLITATSSPKYIRTALPKARSL
jgi:hypothetical protein